MKNILVANAGSSSIKFQVFAVDGGGKLARMIKGQMDGIGTRPRPRASRPDGKSLAIANMTPRLFPMYLRHCRRPAHGCATSSAWSQVRSATASSMAALITAALF